MLRLLLFLSLPLYILDQVTKGLVVKYLELSAPWHQPLGLVSKPYFKVVIPDFFLLHHIPNTGIAFGNFNGGAYSNYIFSVVAVAALSFITWLYRKGLFPGLISRIAIALLVAGVCGNLTDRWVHGYVVDFLSFDLHIPFAHPWPSFNVADSCVVVAAFLLAIASFREGGAKEVKR